MNYFKALQNIEEEKGEILTGRITMEYDFWSDENKIWNNFIELVEDKKAFYLVINGINNINDTGCINDIRVCDTIGEIEEDLHKSHYLTHIWYFNYEKKEVRLIKGVKDDKERFYIKEDGNIFKLYDIYGNCEGVWFDTINECKEYGKRYNSVIYDNLEDLKSFYDWY